MNKLDTPASLYQNPFKKNLFDLLPDEIVQHIASFLFSSASSFACTCKRFKKIVDKSVPLSHFKLGEVLYPNSISLDDFPVEPIAEALKKREEHKTSKKRTSKRETLAHKIKRKPLIFWGLALFSGSILGTLIMIICGSWCYVTQSCSRSVSLGLIIGGNI